MKGLEKAENWEGKCITNFPNYGLKQGDIVRVVSSLNFLVKVKLESGEIVLLGKKHVERIDPKTKRNVETNEVGEYPKPSEKQVEQSVLEAIDILGYDSILIGGSRPQGREGYIGNDIGAPDRIIYREGWNGAGLLIELKGHKTAVRPEQADYIVRGVIVLVKCVEDCLEAILQIETQRLTFDSFAQTQASRIRHALHALETGAGYRPERISFQEKYPTSSLR
jgi:hypothetical protein